MGKGRVGRVNLNHGKKGSERDIPWKQVTEFLLDHVSDHALCLGIEDIKGIGFNAGIGSGLQREQSDLRPVPVREHQFMLMCKRCQCTGCRTDVDPLAVSSHRLAPFQEGVSPKSDYDSHLFSLMFRKYLIGSLGDLSSEK